MRRSWARLFCPAQALHVPRTSLAQGSMGSMSTSAPMTKEIWVKSVTGERRDGLRRSTGAHQDGRRRSDHRGAVLDADEFAEMGPKLVQRSAEPEVEARLQAPKMPSRVTGGEEAAGEGAVPGQVHKPGGHVAKARLGGLCEEAPMRKAGSVQHLGQVRDPRGVEDDEGFQRRVNVRGRPEKGGH